MDSSAASNKEQVTSQSVSVAAVGTSKQVERNLVKNVDVKSQRVQDKGMMVKSVASILGCKAELFTADQIRQLCAHLKLTGYRSKSKDEALRIIAVSKIHSELYDATGITGDGAEKQKAKTKNCIFHLINVLFSDEMSAKFLKLGEKKDKNTLDSGLAAYDELFSARSL